MEKTLKAARNLVSKLSLSGLSKWRQIKRTSKEASQLESQKRYYEAKEKIEEALTLYQGLPEVNKSPSYEASLLGNLGSLLDDMEFLDEARVIHQEAIQKTRELGRVSSVDKHALLSMHLRNFGNTLASLGDLNMALAAYGESISIRRELADKYGAYFNQKVATTLSSYADVLRRIGSHEESQEAYSEALELLGPEDDPSSLSIAADILKGLCQVYCELSEFELAKKNGEEAVRVCRDLGDYPELAFALKTLAYSEEKLGLLPDAEEHISESVEILSELAFHMPGAYEADLSSALNNQGNVFAILEKNQKAEDSYETSIQIRRKLASSLPQAYSHLLASTLANFGTLKAKLGELDISEEALTEAIVLLDRPRHGQKIEANFDQARALFNLGNTHAKKFNLEEARVAFIRAVEIQEQLVEEKPYLFESKLAKTLSALATVLHQLDDLEASWSVFSSALVINRKLAQSGVVPDLVDLTNVLANYASLLHDQSHLDEAVDINQEVVQNEIEIASSLEIEVTSGLGSAYHNLGCSLIERGSDEDVKQAMRCFSEAVRIRSEQNFPLDLSAKTELAMSRTALAKLLFELGDIDTGFEMISLAAHRYHEVEKDEPELAKDHRIDCYAVFGEALLFRYGLHKTPQDIQAAYRWLKYAASLGESLRFQYINPSRRQKHSVRSTQDVLNLLVATCTEIWFAENSNTSILEEAVLYSEQGRMRSLLDTLQEEITPNNTPDEVVFKLRAARLDMLALSEKLHHMEDRQEFDRESIPLLPQAGPTEVLDSSVTNQEFAHAVRSKFYAACDAYQMILEEIRREYAPDFDPEGNSGVVRLKEIQASIGSEQETIIHFSVSPTGCIAILIGRNELEAVRIPEITDSSLEAKARDWLTIHEAAPGDAFDKEVLEKVDSTFEWLSESLVTPVISKLRENVERLIFVPHKALHFLPLSACKTDGGNTLSNRYSLSYAPSLSVLMECQNRNYETGELAATAIIPNQDLPLLDVERARLKSHYEDGVIEYLLSDCADNESLEKIALWHYCGHAKFDYQMPLESFLGEDGTEGKLTLRDAFTRLHFPGLRLAILNACVIGVSKYNVLDEHIGFRDALIRAGAKCVIAASWQIDDLPSMLLIDRFLQQWKGGGTISTALSEAQNWLRGAGDRNGEALRSIDQIANLLESKAYSTAFEDEYKHKLFLSGLPAWSSPVGDPPFAHPVYWAGFIVSGDGRQLWQSK